MKEEQKVKPIDVKPNLFGNLKIGETLNSLPTEENPFKEQMDRMEELKELLQSPDISGSKTEIRLAGELEDIQNELNEAMPKYAAQNSDSLFAVAFATDNPNTSFAKLHPDLVLTGDEKRDFIQDNLNAQQSPSITNGISQIITSIEETIKDLNKYSNLYGSGDRSDELQYLTQTMDEASRTDTAAIIDLKDGRQILLDPTKDGGLNMYGINKDGSTQLIASFDENGKTTNKDIQYTLAHIANNMERDNDSILKNISDIARDSIPKEETKKVDKPKFDLNNLFKADKGQSL